MGELFVTLLDGSVIFIVWGRCLSHCSMDLSYLLYGGSCLVLVTLLDGSVIFIVWGGSCLSHSLMDISYLLYEGVVYHIA